MLDSKIFKIFSVEFIVGSKKISVSYGGLKCDSHLKVSIDKIDDDGWIEERVLPTKFICDKCGKKNLNLRTQDNHKTYDCPKCQKVKEKENVN